LSGMVAPKTLAAGIALTTMATLAAFGAPASERKAAARPKATKAAPAADSRGSRFIGEPISFDLKDADLKDVLRTFAELEKINIAIDPEVRGSVTVRLENVPWDQALEVILATNRLGYAVEGNVLRVGTPERLLPPDRD
jgi:type II secretory pathway component HofQ